MVDYEKLPSHMRSGMQLWIEKGILPGGFLTAVLSNDLRGAAQRADHINKHLLLEYIGWLYDEAPGMCWGSGEEVQAWAKKGGLDGRPTDVLQEVEEPSE